MVSFRVRPAGNDDFQAIYEMAKLTGGGFTNLPPDRGSLVDKLIRSERGFAAEATEPADDLFLFVLENADTGQIRGTCQLFSMVGVEAPFYSYRIGTLTQTSKALGKTFRAQMLNLTTDLEGSSEVGGLFLHPQQRAGGWGSLLARSRYLFMKLHRARFGDRTLAELRGVMDQAGNSPFWDSLAGKFFDMSFPEADEFNAVHGTKFIADLMPRTPIYVSLLTDPAKAVIGNPHPTGRAALRMLEEEGFTYDRYVDIFDGGPTVTSPTERIRTVRESTAETIGEIADGGRTKLLIATGRLRDFRACCASVKRLPKRGIGIDRESAELLNVTVGDQILAVSR
jgi:arginine N-succinyltransferase